MITTTTRRRQRERQLADDDNGNDDHDRGKARDDDDDGRAKKRRAGTTKNRLGDNGWAHVWPIEKHGVNTMWPGQQTGSTDQRGRLSFSLCCCVYGFL